MASRSIVETAINPDLSALRRLRVNHGVGSLQEVDEEKRLEGLVTRDFRRRGLDEIEKSKMLRETIAAVGYGLVGMVGLGAILAINYGVELVNKRPDIVVGIIKQLSSPK